MSKIYFEFGLAEKKVSGLLTGKPTQSSSHFELADNKSRKEGRCFFYCEAEIEFNCELYMGEPLIEVISFKNEFGFEFSANSGGNKAAREIFEMAKKLLDEDETFCNAAFEAVADEYKWVGKGVNDPDGHWVEAD